MTDALQLLREHDDPAQAEAPRDFDRRAAETRFVKMAELIVAAFPESSFETGKAIQDAAFHGEVRLVLGRGCREHAVVRTSNFGGFVGIHDDAHSLNRDQRHRLLTLFADYGYTFIPEKTLALPYEGGNAALRGLADWWDRYFEWL